MSPFPGVTFDRIAVGAIVVSLVLRGQYKDFTSFKFNKLEKWMIIFISILTIELMVTYRPKDAAMRFLMILDVFIIPFLAYYIAKFSLTKYGNSNEGFFRSLVNVFKPIAVCLALMGIFEGITLIDLIPAPESEFSMTHGGGLRIAGELVRVNGPYFTPETFGLVLSMLFFIVLYEQITLSKVRERNAQFKSIGCFVALGALLGGIYFNMFRSIWIGLILGLVSRLFLMPKKRAKMLFVSIFVLIVAVSWVEIKSPDVYKNRIAEEGTFYNRVGAWVYCLRAFSESPVIGIGYGKIYKYIEHAQENMDIIYIKDWKAALEPHNTFLPMLAENGILGLIPFLFLLWYISRYMREYYLRAKDHNDVELSVALISVFVAYFVPMFFDRTGYYPKINNVFYLFVGMMMAKLKNLRSKIVLPQNLS